MKLPVRVHSDAIQPFILIDAESNAICWCNHLEDAYDIAEKMNGALPEEAKFRPQFTERPT